MTNYKDMTLNELLLAKFEAEDRASENPLDSSNRSVYKEVMNEIRCRMEAEIKNAKDTVLDHMEKRNQ